MAPRPLITVGIGELVVDRLGRAATVATVWLPAPPSRVTRVPHRVLLGAALFAEVTFVL